MAKNEKIRIRLKSYDHKLLDFSAGKIVETAKKIKTNDKQAKKEGNKTWLKMKK